MGAIVLNISNKEVMWVIRSCLQKRPLNKGILESLLQQDASFSIVNDYRLGEPVSTISEFFEKTFIPSGLKHIVCIEDDAILSDFFVKEVLCIINRVGGEYGAINLSLDSTAYLIDSHTIYCPSLDLFRRKKEIHYTGSVVISKEITEAFVKKYPFTENHGKSFDLKLSNLCFEENYPHYVSYPSLSRSSGIDSALGNTLKPKDECFTNNPVFSDPKTLDSALTMQKSMVLTYKRQQGLYFG